MRREVSQAIADGANIIVLSDRGLDERRAPIPSLLLTSAVHHHLVREKTRTKVGLVIESGDAREVHHMALLLGYGAAAINPYLAFETIEDMIARGALEDVALDDAVAKYIKAAGKGVLKVMSKMGISTVASYTGAQVFEAVGLGEELVEEYFTGTTSKLGGIGLDEIAAEVAIRHRMAYPDRPTERAHRELEVGGEYQWRREGEYHLFNPETVFKLQHATRSGQYEVFKEYSQMVDQQSRKLATLRGLFTLKEGEREPVPIDEVEPVSEIVKRFSTGAMSYGSISIEAHEHARRRHEPPRRQVEHRRGRRGPRAPLRPRTAVAPSSRWRRVASASPASTSPTATTSRSRWPRAPSPARAASCRATRCTRGSRRPGTPRPASA